MTKANQNLFRDAIKELKILRAENARLRAVAAFVEAKEPLVTEVLRLREALEKIGGPLDWHIENYPHEVRYCVTTARAALGLSTSSESGKKGGE